MMGPCKDCEYRNVGCHSTCEPYLEYKEQTEKAREARMLEKESFPYSWGDRGFFAVKRYRSTQPKIKSYIFNRAVK